MPDTNPPRLTLDDLPLAGCSTWRIHQEHMAAGEPLCENQREQEPCCLGYVTSGGDDRCHEPHCHLAGRP